MKTEITEYSETALALDDLKKRLSTVPDYSNAEGYAEGEEGRKELKGYRVALDKKRKELGAEARKHLELINGEAKKINNVIVGLENPFIEAKKAEDDKAERMRLEEAEKEQKRIESIEVDIRWMKDLVNCIQDVESIRFAINAAEKFDANEEKHQEFLEVIALAKEATLQELNKMLGLALAREEKAAQVAAEAVKQEAQRKELEAQQDEIDRQKAEQQAVADKEAEKLAKERADFEAEKAEAEKVKLAEVERIAAEERQKEHDAAIEKQKADEIEAEKKRNAEETARILADRERFSDDEAELVEFANKILKTTIDVSLLSTTEAVDVAEIAKSALASIAENIVKSAVVQSQHDKPGEDAA